MSVENYSVMAWVQFIWFRISAMVATCEQGNSLKEKHFLLA
jgi:hypothetical protein